VASHQVDDIAGSSLTSTVDLLESGDDVILTEMGSGFGKVLATPAVRRIAGENKVSEIRLYSKMIDRRSGIGGYIYG